MSAAGVPSGPTTISLPLYCEEPKETTWELIQKLASQILDLLREGCRAAMNWCSGTSVWRSLSEYAVFRALSGLLGGAVDSVERVWQYAHRWWLKNDNAALQAEVAALQQKNQSLEVENVRLRGNVCVVGGLYLERHLSQERADLGRDAQYAATARQRDAAEEELARVRGEAARQIEEAPIQVSTPEEGLLAIFSEFCKGSKLIEDRAKRMNVEEDLLRVIRSHGIVGRHLLYRLQEECAARNVPFLQLEGGADVSAIT